MFICFPLLLTQLILNFFHDSQCSRSVRMEVLSLWHSKPGSVFAWNISLTTQQRWEYEAKFLDLLWDWESHDPSSCGSCHLFAEMTWSAGQRRTDTILLQFFNSDSARSALEEWLIIDLGLPGSLTVENLICLSIPWNHYVVGKNNWKFFFLSF